MSQLNRFTASLPSDLDVLIRRWICSSEGLWITRLLHRADSRLRINGAKHRSNNRLGERRRRTCWATPRAEEGDILKDKRIASASAIRSGICDLGTGASKETDSDLTHHQAFLGPSPPSESEPELLLLQRTRGSNHILKSIVP